MLTKSYNLQYRFIHSLTDNVLIMEGSRWSSFINVIRMGVFFRVFFFFHPKDLLNIPESLKILTLPVA